MSGAVTSLRAPHLPDVKGLRIPERTVPLLRDLVHAQTGMHYDDTRLDVLTDRLVPLAIERGFDSLLDYYYLLRYDDAAAAAEWPRVIDSLSVQETYFWREFDQVRALVDVIVPRLAARHRGAIRVWSLPCATGEEPLTLAMALDQAGWFARAPIEIHAGDASQAALARARAGRYGQRAFRQLPARLRDEYFTRDADTAAWQVSRALHARITSWTQINVVQRGELAAVAGADVVFCRNMFIYFQEATVRQVVGDLAELMATPGYLCVGAAESLLRLNTPFELQDVAGAFVYVKS